jgi:hypothetical protein
MASRTRLRYRYPDRRVREIVEPPFKHDGTVCVSVDLRVKSIYGTILEMGISRMSVAPFDFRRGISVLTVALSTTVSMA